MSIVVYYTSRSTRSNRVKEHLHCLYNARLEYPLLFQWLELYDRTFPYKKSSSVPLELSFFYNQRINLGTFQ